MKLLLYCTKAKPYLYPHFNKLYFTKNKDFGNVKLNGKIVAECDFEVEEIKYRYDTSAYRYNNINDYYYTNTLNFTQLEKRSCLTNKDLLNYLGQNGGYAINIKNLHIFDKPKELSDFNKIIETPYGEEPDTIITKAPQNMMRCCYEKKPKEWKTGIIISIRPQHMCLILNYIKDVEVRRVVLKEMLK